MAGIGFSLRKLFDKKGIFNLCRAYGYAGIISTGPMLLGVALLGGISFAARLGGMPPHDRELLNCLLTYSLLASLFISSWFNMGVTRFISDMFYEEKNDKVMSSFYGSTAIMLVLCVVLYGTFLHFSGVSLAYRLLCLWFSLVLIVVWNEMIYLTAVKDYQSIVLSFSISLMTGFLLVLIAILLGFVRIEVFMLAIIAAYGLLMCRYLKVLLDYFPTRMGSNFSFLAWMDKYRSVVITGGMLNIGLFSHMIIMYFGPLQVQVEGFFYGAPQYDIPALFAFSSLMITTINFIASVEVRFYPKYRDYYGLFNDNGCIRDIEQAEAEMLSVLRQELVYAGHKQLFTTILFIVIAPPVLEALPLGFTALSADIFRFLCVGYGTYAIANSMMLILLYFEDYAHALIGSSLFAVISTAVTIWQVLYGNRNFYGVGFFAGTLVFFVVSVIGLEYHTKRLPYYLLARQSILPRKERGPLVFIADKLDARQERLEAQRQSQSAADKGNAL
ncbi:exopolysaccharide Pel transporter PelG [Oscillibacter sp.]|uniref:exopolysaccharide Pel transporter PelG n=1 Tax=Oscillibacter sp. TaxID=1945593 RepID=UPI001B7766B9|nr:exopolysaccharide Pel transporter PelG [Oscillibacter sp.]MBP3508241.1 exopolysaccharide Pel transporter PelG [Oscillibacter sp.]